MIKLKGTKQLKKLRILRSRRRNKKNIERAGYLCKADLTTKMVTEFTELQGKMGMEYARNSEKMK